MADRHYSTGTVEALFMLSRGHCYAPRCRKRVIRFAGDSWQISVHIAHIEGLKPGSARYNKASTDRERNKFANLILLCKEDHGQVDSKKNEQEYSVDVLKAWKSNVEGAYADDLDELDWLTEDKLQDLMASAIAETRTTLLVAIANVHDVGAETLEILKNLVEESFTRPYLDADAVASLEYSAGVFEQLPNHAELLYMSSNAIRHLPDSTESLTMSSYRLQDLDGTVQKLTDAARLLQEFQDCLPWLTEIADKLPSSRSISILNEVASGLDSYQLSQAVESLESARNSVNSLTASAADVARLESVTSDLNAASASFDKAVPRENWSWNSFRWGLGVAVVLVIGILILFTVGVLHTPITIQSG